MRGEPKPGNPSQPGADGKGEVGLGAPQVSVILPVRNRVRLVEAAARCVLDQSWTDLELILVDGASTDGTRDVLQRLAGQDPRVRLVFHDHPEGPSAARNAGVKIARGRYVAFQDSDDAWHPTKLERQMEALAAFKGARMAYAGTRRTLPSGPQLRPPTWDGAEGDLHRRLLATSLITTPSLVVDRELFLAEGGFDERLSFNEDWDLAIRLSARTPVACAKDWLVQSTRQPDSLSADRTLQLDSLAVLAEKHEPLLQPYPREHEQRFVDAGLALVASGRDGWPLVRRGLAARPFGLHTAFWKAGGRLLRARLRRHRRGRAGDAT